jgi:hypothetical protein
LAKKHGSGSRGNGMKAPLALSTDDVPGRDRLTAERKANIEWRESVKQFFLSTSQII